ncbi:MAG: hypothetical protein IJO96_06760 [Oscillospiraceae bacterium]|nr:hypothetical protein [Oscillospiraceae bacterium]
MNKIRTVVILTLIFGFILSGCSATDKNKGTDENIAPYPVELDESVRNEIDALFERVLSRGTTYQECIEKAPVSYEKLISYGAPTVHYCFEEFLYGNPSKLKEELMARISDKIFHVGNVRKGTLGMWSIKGVTSPGEDYTGREWFDCTYSNAKVFYDFYVYEDFQYYFPLSDLLLRMTGDIK